MSKLNEWPVGPIVDPLPPGHVPDLRPLFGRWARLEAVRPAIHALALHESFANDDPAGRIWTYMGYGPFSGLAEFSAWLEERSASRDPWFYVFIRRDTGLPSGMGAFMRADAKNGVIEIGHIWMSPGMQRTREATESIFLMMRHAFDELGVRRLEWKCDALNVPSRKAADRFGFTHEGVFRQHMIVKGRNRDTAWYSIIDKDWPTIRQGFQKWLRDENFAPDGSQKSKLRVK